MVNKRGRGRPRSENPKDKHMTFRVVPGIIEALDAYAQEKNRSRCNSATIIVSEFLTKEGYLKK